MSILSDHISSIWLILHVYKKTLNIVNLIWILICDCRHFIFYYVKDKIVKERRHRYVGLDNF